MAGGRHPRGQNRLRLMGWGQDDDLICKNSPTTMSAFAHSDDTRMRSASMYSCSTREIISSVGWPGNRPPTHRAHSAWYTSANPRMWPFGLSRIVGTPFAFAHSRASSPTWVNAYNRPG